MFRIRDVSRAALIVCAGSLASLGHAQTQVQTPASELKKVEVTGSRIKRIDSETASPVSVITREQIERSGATTITEVLRSAPSGNAGAFDENAVNSFTTGAGGVSLRGLGPQSTLILINGRRVAPFGFAANGQQTFVDVNSIPLDAVERIETLLDGASAIYGSDAIAGVVNIILRKDFNGAIVSASGGRSSYGDAGSGTFAVTLGKGSLAEDKYNFFGTYSHNQKDPVLASDRPNTQTADFRRFGLTDGRKTTSNPGNLYNLDTGAFLAPAAGCTTVVNEPGNPLNGRCAYDIAKYTDIVIRSKRDNLFFAGTIDLGNSNELFGDASFTRDQYVQRAGSYSSAVYFPDTTGVPLDVGHPQNPYPFPVALRYRFNDVPTLATVQSDTQRVVLGARGNWFGWDAETAMLFSRSNTGVDSTGTIRDSVLFNEVIDANGFAVKSFQFGNPSANDPALMARLYPNLHNQGTTSTTSVDIHGSRDLMQLAGGALGLSVGAEVRRESFVSTPDALLAANEISVFGASSADGSRTVSAFYAELSAPLLKSLETSLAARVDQYSDFGSAVTPKASIKWKIAPTFAVRSTYSEGFRAPALTEIAASPTRGFLPGIRDPKLCPDPSDTNNLNCSLDVQNVSGSNPKLTPEKSKSFSMGLVFEPTDSFSITLDTYNIKRTDEISSIDANYLLANEASFPGFVVRDAKGVIKQLNTPYTNLGSTHVIGWDLDVKSRFNWGEYGKLGVEGSYTASPTYLVANVPGAAELEYAGTYNQPKQRAKLNFTWDKGPWTLSTSFNYTGGFLAAFSPSDLTCPYSNGAHPELCEIAAQTTTDLFIGYKGFKNLDLGLTIVNVGNQSPPISQPDATSLTLFSNSYYNALGRYATFKAKYTF